MERARLATTREARAQRGAQQAWRARCVRPGRVYTSPLSYGRPGRGPGRGILGGGAEPRVHRGREAAYARLACGELPYGVQRADHYSSALENSSFVSSNQSQSDRGAAVREAVRPAARAEPRRLKDQGLLRQVRVSSSKPSLVARPVWASLRLLARAGERFSTRRVICGKHSDALERPPRPFEKLFAAVHSVLEELRRGKARQAVPRARGGARRPAPHGRLRLPTRHNSQIGAEPRRRVDGPRAHPARCVASQSQRAVKRRRP